MAERTEFQVLLFSPRWGRDDTYNLQFSREKMQIDGPKSAECTWVEDGDPVWTGYQIGQGNPLVNIMKNDHIYPPSVFVSALEWAWSEWRNTGLNEDIVQEVKGLFEWVNQITMSKPSSAFWSKFF
ncbi:Hypothetical protein Dalk_0001_AVC [Desulfatibacillum aliphaticivorans]|uniref:Integron cassette protein domain-containing protein n=1 Tax=Desulfatibacillum aliphaticivorans TaxID=218208 RepID=F3ZV42_DESAL|nr:hypothetical protein [Desulfatibacillum aliphaticivorans]AEB80269.1 Hypothetical protein Dalk_0001_AVC [Desulfatibacillum aliphaticivorans]